MKYSPEIVKEICELYSQAIKVKDICKNVDITPTTYYEWHNTKPEFAEAIKKAYEKRRTKIKDIAVLSIVDAMQKGQWQAGAWWLERNHPEEFGKQLNLNIADQDQIEKATNELRSVINGFGKTRNVIQGEQSEG